MENFDNRFTSHVDFNLKSFDAQPLSTPTLPNPRTRPHTMNVCVLFMFLLNVLILRHSYVFNYYHVLIVY
jgi:hypothetical protein